MYSHRDSRKLVRISFASKSLEGRVGIGCATRTGLIMFNVVLFLVTLKLAKRVYEGDA